MSSVRISITTFPGILLKTATLMPVGVSEPQNTTLAVPWLGPKALRSKAKRLSPKYLGFC